MFTFLVVLQWFCWLLSLHKFCYCCIYMHMQKMCVYTNERECYYEYTILC